jgi:rare lipoprotein A
MKNLGYCLLFCCCTVGLPVIAQTKPHEQVAKKNAKTTARVQYGTASYYANKFQGRKTANDEIFDQHKMTCAHNRLPFGTWLKVTNLRNGRSVVVRVNDRLHPRNKRLVDLSRAAAAKLGYLGHGLTRVKVEVLGKKPPANLTNTR